MSDAWAEFRRDIEGITDAGGDQVVVFSTAGHRQGEPGSRR